MTSVEGGHGRGGALETQLRGLRHRPSLDTGWRMSSSSISNSSISSNPSIGDEKPLASANGISIFIALAEPALYLQGFDQAELGSRATAMLRGTFHLRVSKAAKIKAVSLTFRGRAETEWPEGRSIASGPEHCNAGGLTFNRNSAQADRIQRSRKHHESHLALFQCSIPNRPVWLRRRSSAFGKRTFDHHQGARHYRIILLPTQGHIGPTGIRKRKRTKAVVVAAASISEHRQRRTGIRWFHRSSKRLSDVCPG